jgi:hypothetical protein
LTALPGVTEVRATGETGADIYADRGGALIPAIVNAAASAGIELSDVHISEPSLENLFLHHTGRSLRSGAGCPPSPAQSGSAIVPDVLTAVVIRLHLWAGDGRQRLYARQL